MIPIIVDQFWFLQREKSTTLIRHEMKIIYLENNVIELYWYSEEIVPIIFWYNEYVNNLPNLLPCFFCFYSNFCYKNDSLWIRVKKFLLVYF